MPVIYVFASDGTCLEKRGGALTPALEAAYRTKFGQDIHPTDWPEDPHPDHYGTGDFTAEFQGGQVVDIAVAPGPEEKFLHVAITAPGTGPTGVPSVAAGETAAIAAGIREDEAPESGLMAFTGTIRVPYRKNGVYHGEMRMEFMGGQCAYTFAPQAHHHGTLSISEADFGLLSGYKVRVIGDPKLIVDEISAA